MTRREKVYTRAVTILVLLAVAAWVGIAWIIVHFLRRYW